jgi:hypothetical protein
MRLLKRTGIQFICSILLLSGCVTIEKGSSSKQLAESIIGPKLSSFFDHKKMAKIDPNKKKLEVIVPVFDPGLSEDAEKYKKEDIKVAFFGD